MNTTLSLRAAKALFQCENFSEGNTTVTVRQTDADEYMTELRLHGNVIATLDPSHGLWITDAGWNTQVTRVRLNALPSVTVNGDKLNGELWDGEWISIDYKGSDVDKLFTREVA